MITRNQLKDLARLKQAKFRKAMNCFLIEGEKLVQELISGAFPVEILHVLGDEKRLEDAAILQHKAFSSLSMRELSQLSTQATPDKVIAVVRKREVQPPQEEGWYFFMDGVQDPGNAGAIYRIADWFGFAGVILSVGCPDPCSPKVIRGSMGASLRIPSWSEVYFETLQNKGYSVFVADMGGTPIAQSTFPKKGILVVGSEGKGVRNEWLEDPRFHVLSIEKKGEGESLNVSVAAGIIAYQASLQ